MHDGYLFFRLCRINCASNESDDNRLFNRERIDFGGNDSVSKSFVVLPANIHVVITILMV